MKRLLCLLFLLCVLPVHAQDTVLWRIHAGGASTSSFLVGTNHYFGSSFVDSHPVVLECLRQSELAIFEALVDPDAARRRVNAREPSDAIEKQLRRKEFEKLREISKDWKVDLYKLNPFEVTITLEGQFQRDICIGQSEEVGWSGLDGYLMHVAREIDIELHALESLDKQFALVEEDAQSPGWRQERKKIRYWIRQLTSADPAMHHCELAQDYRNLAIRYEFEKACEDDVLLKPRNAAWMEVLPDLIRSKRSFIAVGIMHLRQQCGLIQQFRRAGFTVEPVSMKAGEPGVGCEP